MAAAGAIAMIYGLRHADRLTFFARDHFVQKNELIQPNPSSLDPTTIQELHS